MVCAKVLMGLDPISVGVTEGSLGVRAVQQWPVPCIFLFFLIFFLVVR